MKIISPEILIFQIKKDTKMVKSAQKAPNYT